MSGLTSFSIGIADIDIRGYSCGRACHTCRHTRVPSRVFGSQRWNLNSWIFSESKKETSVYAASFTTTGEDTSFKLVVPDADLVVCLYIEAYESRASLQDVDVCRLFTYTLRDRPKRSIGLLCPIAVEVYLPLLFIQGDPDHPEAMFFSETVSPIEMR